jgi:hypothetical protein
MFFLATFTAADIEITGENKLFSESENAILSDLCDRSDVLM